MFLFTSGLVERKCTFKNTIRSKKTKIVTIWSWENLRKMLFYQFFQQIKFHILEIYQPICSSKQNEIIIEIMAT